MNPLTLYDSLGIARNASQKEIKTAYHILVRKYHPDVTQEEKNLAEAKMKEINEAYKILSDEEERDIYNQSQDLITTEPRSIDKAPIIKITMKDFFFLSALARETHLDLGYIGHCFFNEKDKFSRIDSLKKYLSNHHTNTEPGLSLNEVLNTTYEEYINLDAAYHLIEKKFLTIVEAKALTERQRKPILERTNIFNWEPIIFNEAWCQETMDAINSSEPLAKWTKYSYESVSQTVFSFFGFYNSPSSSQKTNVEPSTQPPDFRLIIEFTSKEEKLADKTGVPLLYLLEYLCDRVEHRYLKIELAERYLNNRLHGNKPALTLQEVTSMSYKEVKNLMLGYDLIACGYMTIDQVKVMNDKQQACLLKARELHPDMVRSMSCVSQFFPSETIGKHPFADQMRIARCVTALEFLDRLEYEQRWSDLLMPH